jgi:hypothetical protein
MSEVPEGLTLVHRHNGMAKYAVSLNQGRDYGWLYEKINGRWVIYKKLSEVEIEKK